MKALAPRSSILAEDQLENRLALELEHERSRPDPCGEKKKAG